MRGFWHALVDRYAALGGTLRLKTKVIAVAGRIGDFVVETRRGAFAARQIVSALPVATTAQIAPAAVAQRLQGYLQRDACAMGGAIVLFLGVPEAQVAGQAFTHHQLLQDYSRPLGNGNNMFISVSAAGDTQSAPVGHRAVMISTHCDLQEWEHLSADRYEARKREVGDGLLALARRVYPELGHNALVREIGTPRTYERFVRRPRGAVGGVRQSVGNSNQHAVPHDLGVPGFWLAGDTTWPGLGTVACVLGSRIVARGVIRAAQSRRRAFAVPASAVASEETHEHCSSHQSDSRQPEPAQARRAG